MLRRLAIPLLFLAPVLILGSLSLRLFQNERVAIETSYREQAQAWVDAAHESLFYPTRADNAVALHVRYPITPPTIEHELVQAYHEARELPPKKGVYDLQVLLIKAGISEVYTTSGQHLPTLITYHLVLLLERQPTPETTALFLKNLHQHPTELTPLLLEKSKPFLQKPDPQLLQEISSQIPIYEKLRSLSTYPQGKVDDWPKDGDQARFTEDGVTVISTKLLAEEIRHRIEVSPPPEWLTYLWEGDLNPSGGIRYFSWDRSPNRFNFKKAIAQKRTENFTLSAYPDDSFIQTSINERLSRLKLILLFTVLLTALASTIAYLTLRKQQQLSALQSDFVASVSHELRTPITSIRLLSERLQKETLPAEKSDQYHRLISNESQRLGNLVENILDFSRIEKGRKLYHFEPTDLSALLAETLQLIQPNLDQKKHTLTTNIDLPTDFSPNLDSLAIRQLLLNLLDNALKFTPAPGIIALAATTSPDTLKLIITDTGPGIPASERTKVFQRFYRRDRNTEVTGTGIGLSLVQHIVQAHKGTITITDNPDQKTGTRLTINLPLKEKT
ncbi:MAG: sensor histidine kinase [Roseibacillus sp.]